MPFTFSHPALVIPLLRGRRRCPWLSATGLIAGSVAPDFEKFFSLRLASSHSHTLASITYFSLPVALALAFVFHMLVRQPLVAHLPAALQRRVGKYAGFDWPLCFRQYYWGVLLSIVVGAASHLLWDSFTHPNAMMRLLPGATTSGRLGSWALNFYQVSGIVNSALGGLALVLFVWRMPQQSGGWRPPHRARQAYWALATLVAAGLLALWLLVASSHWIDFGITAISASMVGVGVASACFRTSARSPIV